MSRSHITESISSEFSVVSGEVQTQHCTTFHVRFKSMTLRYQVCFVRIRVHVGECRLLLLQDILHEIALEHYMFHPSQTSFGCLRTWTVDMLHESHFVSQFVQEVLRHHPFRNSSCQGV